MPLITYDGPALDKRQRQLLIKAFSELAARVVPSIPKGANYVIIRDMTKKKGGTVTTSNKELEAMRKRVDVLEKALSQSMEGTKIVAGQLAVFKREQTKREDKVNSGLSHLWEELDKLIRERDNTREQLKALHILFSIGRLLSLPEFEKHKNIVVPQVRKLLLIYKKLTEGTLKHEDADQQFSSIIDDLERDLKKQGVPSHHLVFRP